MEEEEMSSFMTGNTTKKPVSMLFRPNKFTALYTGIKSVW
jgi:hypothetical protein